MGRVALEIFGPEYFYVKHCVECRLDWWRFHDLVSAICECVGVFHVTGCVVNYFLSYNKNIFIHIFRKLLVFQLEVLVFFWNGSKTFLWKDIAHHFNQKCFDRYLFFYNGWFPINNVLEKLFQLNHPHVHCDRECLATPMRLKLFSKYSESEFGPV